jgi:hypothetical protein
MRVVQRRPRRRLRHPGTGAGVEGRSRSRRRRSHSRRDPRGTDCPRHQARWRSVRTVGFRGRGRDEEGAGVRSCSVVGQGDCARVHARRARVLRHAMVLVAASRGRMCATAFRGWSAGITPCDCCATRLGAVPRSSAGADPSRGAGRCCCSMARRFHLASCTRYGRATGLPRDCSASRTRERGRTTERTEYRQRARFAQPMARTCELRAGNEKPARMEDTGGLGLPATCHIAAPFSTPLCRFQVPRPAFRPRRFPRSASPPRSGTLGPRSSLLVRALVQPPAERHQPARQLDHPRHRSSLVVAEVVELQ